MAQDKPVGAVQTGVTSSLKAGAINAQAETDTRAKKDAQEAEAMTSGKGDVVYTKEGEPTFNTIYGPQNKRINFIGGKFMVRANDRDAKAICEALDYFVDEGTIKKVEGKAEG